MLVWKSVLVVWWVCKLMCRGLCGGNPLAPGRDPHLSSSCCYGLVFCYGIPDLVTGRYVKPIGVFIDSLAMDNGR